MLREARSLAAPAALGPPPPPGIPVSVNGTRAVKACRSMHLPSALHPRPQSLSPLHPHKLAADCCLLPPPPAIPGSVNGTSIVRHRTPLLPSPLHSPLLFYPTQTCHRCAAARGKAGQTTHKMPSPLLPPPSDVPILSNEAGRGGGKSGIAHTTIAAIYTPSNLYHKPCCGLMLLLDWPASSGLSCSAQPTATPLSKDHPSVQGPSAHSDLPPKYLGCEGSSGWVALKWVQAMAVMHPWPVRGSGVPQHHTRKGRRRAASPRHP